MKSKKGNNDPFYGSVKVGERGQIVLPVEIRDKFNIKGGDILFVCEDGKQIKVLKGDLVKKVLNLE